MKKQLAILGVGLFVLGMAGVGTASAISITATITADNHYGLYYGTPGDITFVGRNELGSSGVPGQYNWTYPETYTFSIGDGDSVYVAGWSDDSVAQGWIGEFNILGGPTVYSNTVDWDVDLQSASFNIGDGSLAPTTSAMETQVASALWLPVNFSIANGSGPWGSVGAIDSGASWIWGTPLQPGSGNGEYQIFRWSPEPVPEPTSLLLLGSGLLGLALVRRKKALKS